MRFPAPIAVPFLAAGLACAAGQAGHAETLSLAVNHSLRLPVAGRAASVVVGNAAVADVSVIDSRTLFVTGKSPGSTDLSVIDPLGRTLYAASVAVSTGAGAAVTVHRARETAEMSCDPRCTSPGQPRPTGFAAVMDDLAGLSAARAATATATAPTVQTASTSSLPLGPVSFSLPSPR